MLESRVRVDKTEVRSAAGMVTALHPVGARAGAEILKRGGNTVDALIATLAAMSVVEPFMSGLGGHGAALVAWQDEAPVVVDGSATAPAAFTAGSAELYGARAVSTPNAVRAWTQLHEGWASMELSELLEPAITLARDGSPVEWYTAMMIAGHIGLIRQDPEAMSTFLIDGWRPPAPAMMHENRADLLSIPDLAATLSRFARNGVSEFAGGQTGARIAETVSSLGGWLREEDLRSAPEAEPYPALRGSFRGFEVHAGPVTGAGTAVLQMLTLLESLDPELVPLGSADYYEKLIMVQGAARVDREYLGDPRFVDVPLGAYTDARLAALRTGDMQRFPGTPIPARDLRSSDYRISQPTGNARTGSSGTSTTHVNVVDRHGNIASATFTIGHPFGSGLVVPGTGLLLLNTLNQFADDPAHPNAPTARKRAAWNGSPIIVTRQGQPVLAIGAPGGPRISAALVQVLVNHLVYGLSPQASVQVPRVFSGADGVRLDDRVPPEVVDALRQRGHSVNLVRESYSSVNFARPGLISLDSVSGEWVGGIDEWRIGAVVGL